MTRPRLRFRRDDGTEYPAWEAKLFGLVMTVLPNNTLSRDELTYNADGVKNIHYGDVLIKFGACLDVSSIQLPAVANPQKIRNLPLARLRNGDVVIADTAEDSTVGKAAEIVGCDNELVVSGLHTIPCRPEDNCFALGFLGYYINSSAFHDQLKPLMQGVKVTSINKKAVQEETFLSLPCLEEQQKIAAFLSDLDAVISASEAEVAALEQQKKGAMQKIFSQEVRFRRDDGTEYPEWEEKKLGDLGSFIRGLSYNKNEVTDDKTKTLVLRSNNIIVGGVANCENGLQYVTKRPSSEQLLIKDDVIICLANGSDSLVGKTCSYNGDYIGPITVGAFCGIYRSQSPIMHYLVQTENYRRKIILIKQGGNGALANLYGNDILTLSFSIPSCLEEQQKIADFLSSFDEAIAFARQELEKWKLLKKGLMQQMFV